MGWLEILLLIFGAQIVLMFLGVPVAIAFFTIDILGLLYLFGFDGLSLLISSMYQSVSNIGMAPIPLFILLGSILFESNVIDIVFDTVNKWTGNIRARLLIVTLVTAIIFGALSGSAMAVAAMFAVAVMPQLKKEKYSESLSIGAIIGGSCLAAIIPPTMLGVLVATLAYISVGKYLLALTLPGVLIGVAIIVYSLIRIRLNPSLAPTYSTVDVSWRERFISLLRLLPFLLIIFAVLGTIFFGIASPTESAALGAVASLLVSAMFGRLSLNVVKRACYSTIKTTGMIMLIVASAHAFSQVLAGTQALQGLVNAVSQLQLPPILFFIVMMTIVFILGCFIEQNSIVLMTVPIYAALVTALNFDPIWFWVIYLINISLGGLTPPFGFILFTFQGAKNDIPLINVYKAAIPIVLIFILVMVVFTLFPQLIVQPI